MSTSDSCTSAAAPATGGRSEITPAPRLSAPKRRRDSAADRSRYSIMSSSVSLSHIVPLLACNATPPRAVHGRRGVGGFCDGRGAPSNPLTISAIGSPNPNTCTASLLHMTTHDFGGLNPTGATGTPPPPIPPPHP